MGLAKFKKHREKKKVSTTLYLLRKTDRSTQKVFPIVVVMIANLGSERISFKEIKFSGLTDNGVETSGSLGWYEEPEAAFGIRKRLLPTILESGQVNDLPLLSIGIFTQIENLKIWLSDFDDIKFKGLTPIFK